MGKYLQLVLFSIITSVDNKEYFGNNNQLFEAINSDEFRNKLQDTVKDMEKVFNFKNMNFGYDNSSNTNDNNDNSVNFEKMFNSIHKDLSNINFDNITDNSNNPFDFENIFKNMNNSVENDNSENKFNNLPDSDTIFSHINNLINGKIGSLAKELAEETSKDLDMDMENVTDVNDVFTKLFKNQQS